MANISSDAQKVLAEAGAGAEEYVLNQGGFGGKLTSGEATRLLAGFKADTGSVFSTDNIGGEAQRPDDLLGIRAGINEELGIPGLETTFQDAFGQLKEFDVTTGAQQEQIEQRLAGMATITGSQAAARTLRARERVGIATQAEIAQSALLAAKQEAQERFYPRPWMRTAATDATL